jgi:chromosome segregation ATPase
MCPDHHEWPEKDPVFPRTTDALGADIKNSDEVLEADQVRRADDRRTEARHDAAEEDQHEGARALDQNAQRLRETGSVIDEVHQRATANRERLEDLREGVESLRRDTDELSEDVDSTGPASPFSAMKEDDGRLEAHGRGG